MALPAIFVEVGAKIDGFERAMGTVSQQLNTIDRDAQKAFSGFERLGSNLTTLGTAMTAGITLPLVGAGAAVTSFAKDFELEMRKVTSLLGTSTNAEFEKLSGNVLALSRSMGIDATKAASALYEAISAGVPKENAVEFLAVASKAAVAGVTDTKVAVDGLTSIINSYGLEFGKAREVSDAMFQSVNLGKFSFEQLASSISIATPLAAQLGIGFKDLLAAAATLTSQGYSVSEAMTSLRSAMVGIITPNKDMNALLAQTGFSSGQALIGARGLHGALETLQVAAGGNVEVLTKAIGRVEGLGAVLGLTGDKTVIARGHLDSLRNSTGAAGAAFDEIEKSSARAFERVTAELKVTAIEIGTALLPTVNALLQSIHPLVAALGDAAKWFASLDPTIKTVAISLAAAAAAFGPVVLAVGGMIQAFSTVGAAVTSLTASIGVAGGAGLTAALAAAGPLAIAFGAAVAGWAIYKAISEIGQLDAEIRKLETALQAGKKANEDQATTIKVLENAIAQHNRQIGVQQVQVDAAGKSVTEYIDALKKATKENSISFGVLDKGAGTVKVAVKGNKDLAAAIAGVGTQAKATGKHTLSFAEAVEKEMKAILAAEQGTKAHEEALRRLGRESETAKKQARDNEEAYNKWRDAGERLKQSTLELSLDYSKSHERMRQESLKTVDIIVPLTDRIPASVRAAIKTNDELVESYKRLGVTSTADLKRMADQHLKDYERIRDSGKATAYELEQAFGQWADAAIKAAKAAGEEIPAEIDSLMGQANKSTSKGLDEQANRWGDFRNSVSTVITNFAQDIGKSLWDGDMSWGEKGKNLLKSLGEATTSLFIEPATKAISEFITGVLSDLISGKGLGGVLGQAKEIGKELKDIFTAGGGSAVGAAANATQTAGDLSSAPSSGGAASSASSGVLGIVNAISGVATAVSSIVGNFQMAGMNKSLDLIEHETRFSQIHLKELVERAQNLFLAELPVIRGLEMQLLNDHAWRIHDVWERLGTLIDVVRNETNPLLRGDGSIARGNITLNFYGPASRDTIDYAMAEVTRNLR